MTDSSPPPTYTAFTQEHPKLASAWSLIREAEAEGPLDERTRRIVKLAVSLATRSQGATHSATRKALRAGIRPEEMQQVVALSASVIGLPASVAAYSWIQDVLEN